MQYPSSFSYVDAISILLTKTFDTSDTQNANGVMKHLKTLTQMDWFMNYGVMASWLNEFSVPFSLTLTQWGICFTFNMISSSELVLVNETSPDFHYNADIVNPVYIASIESNSFYFNETFPWSATNSRRFLILYFDNTQYVETNPFVELQGYRLIFHSNYELPYKDEKNHVIMGPKKFITVDINPDVFEADESLAEMEPKE